VIRWHRRGFRAKRPVSPRPPSPPCWSRATIVQGSATRSLVRSAKRGST
jgi:hypothetical protein